MKIVGVEKGSVGESLGLKPGDEIFAMGGYPLEDILDYEFYDASENFSIDLGFGDEKPRVIPVKKKSSRSLGLTFSDDGLKLKTCRNRCMFCFVDQLPKNPDLRKTLRVKDDDYRYSFLYGAYVTLTNLTEADLARIKRIRLSPLYISVHTTNEDLRQKMLGVCGAPPVLPLIRELSEAKIKIHAQIVYCPGLNEDLEKTANDLAPYVQSLAVVPVGLTKFQNPDLRAVSKTEASDIISLTKTLQEGFLKTKGTRFVWASDEFFIKAGAGFPEPETYEYYPQIENGVGLFAQFNQDFAYALDGIKRSKKKKTVSVATGESAYAFICEKAKILAEKSGVQIDVYKVENHFFGPSVTVAGLLSGGDILRELTKKPLGEKLLLPDVMFREGGEEFLDGMTLLELSGQLGVPVEKIPSDGGSFAERIIK